MYQISIYLLKYLFIFTILNNAVLACCLSLGLNINVYIHINLIECNMAIWYYIITTGSFGVIDCSNFSSGYPEIFHNMGSI